MTWWQAALLGLVEGITEYLPVSSTGHLILTAALLGLDRDPQTKAAVDAFNIVIQGGAILAVLGLYRARVLQMLLGVLGMVRIGPGHPAGMRLALHVLVAFLPAAVLGVLFDDLIEQHLFNAPGVLTALALGGLYMIALDRWRVTPMRNADQRAQAGEPVPDAQRGHTLDQLTIPKALIIGAMQCVAMWPGTSRSMMTITGGVVAGLRPRDAAEFSFLLGLPTLGAACLYKLYKNLSESAEAGTPNMFEVIGVAPILVGVAVATGSAAAAVKWLVGFLNRHGLTPFGIYRMVLAAVLGGALATGLLTLGPA